MSFFNTAAKFVAAAGAGYGANYAAHKWGGVEKSSVAGVGAAIVGAGVGWFVADALVPSASVDVPAIAAGIATPVVTDITPPPVV